MDADIVVETRVSATFVDRRFELALELSELSLAIRIGHVERVAVDQRRDFVDVSLLVTFADDFLADLDGLAPNLGRDLTALQLVFVVVRARRRGGDHRQA